MRVGLVVCGLVLGAPGAMAQDLNSMMRAQELATVLAAETVCGLTLDQAGIEAWIAQNVADTDLSFAGTLQVMTQGAAFQANGMTAAAKTAHCAAVKRTAGTMGLIK